MVERVRSYLNGSSYAELIIFKFRTSYRYDATVLKKEVAERFRGCTGGRLQFDILAGDGFPEEGRSFVALVGSKDDIPKLMEVIEGFEKSVGNALELKRLALLVSGE